MSCRRVTRVVNRASRSGFWFGVVGGGADEEDEDEEDQGSVLLWDERDCVG